MKKVHRKHMITRKVRAVEDDAQIKAFLNAIDINCKILITSRNIAVISPDQVNLQVDTLTDKNAILLMRKELEKNGRPELSVDEYIKLLETIGGSPLAIKWSIGQIATNGHTVDTICAQLRDGDIEREWQNIDKAIRFSIENIGRMENQDEVKIDALEISKAINVFLWSRGYWQERIDVCKRALSIAESLKRNEEAGQFACFIGIVLFWQSKNSEAEKWATRAEKLLENSARAKRVLAERLRGLTKLGNQNFDEAIDALNRVFAVLSNESDEDVSREDVAIIADWIAPSRDGYKAGRVSLLQEIGICYNRMGDYNKALASLRHSESLARSICDDEGLSISLSHLGHSLVGLEMYKEAKKAYIEGLEIALSVGRKSTTARCYEGLTRVAKRQKNIVAKVINGRKALALFERLNMQQELGACFLLTIGVLAAEKQAQFTRREKIQRFCDILAKTEQPLVDFNARLWCAVVETVSVYSLDRMVVRFASGTRVEIAVDG